jgi:hypothetical protein
MSCILFSVTHVDIENQTHGQWSWKKCIIEFGDWSSRSSSRGPAVEQPLNNRVGIYNLALVQEMCFIWTETLRIMKQKIKQKM